MLGPKHKGAAAGDEEEGKAEVEVVFAAGRPKRPFYRVATGGGNHEERPTIRSRRMTSGTFVARASRLHQGRKRSMQAFQSDIANERSFAQALAGVELEDVRPNTTQIEPRLQLPWPFLLRLKVNTFAVPFGLSSQAQLWGSLSRSSLVTSALGGAIPSVVQWMFWVLALGLLIIIALAYFCKAVLYWGAVKREWAHPIRSNFVFTPFLASLTVVAAVPRPISQALHPSTTVPLPAFMFLSTLVLYLEMASYGKWLFNQTRSLSRANPSYQLAVVGNFIVARLGTQVSGGRGIEIACGEISLFFFAVGILYLLLVFFAIQHHSANNVVQPSSATSAETVPPHRATRDAVSTGGGNRDGGTGSAGDSRRQQSPHQDHHHNRDKTVSAAVVAGWGRRPPKLSTGVEQDNGDVPVPAATSSCVLRTGREELESKDDGTPAGRDVGQSGASDITARWPVLSPSQQHCFSSGLVHQDSVSGSRRVPMGGEVSEQRDVMEAAVTAPAAPATAVVAPTQAPARTMTRGAIDERAVLSRALHPIYFLFVAPPSAAAIAWEGISGEFDRVAKSLYFIAGFLYVFFVVGNSSFLRTASFSIAWWAYSFPSSTFAVATIMYAEELSSEGVVLVALALALASTLLVLVVFALTLSSALTGTLFGPDPVLSVLLEEEAV